MQTRIPALPASFYPSNFQNASILLIPCFSWLKRGPDLSPELFHTLRGGDQMLLVSRALSEGCRALQNLGRVWSSCACEGFAEQPQAVVLPGAPRAVPGCSAQGHCCVQLQAEGSALKQGKAWAEPVLLEQLWGQGLSRGPALPALGGEGCRQLNCWAAPAPHRLPD